MSQALIANSGSIETGKSWKDAINPSKTMDSAGIIPRRTRDSIGLKNFSRTHIKEVAKSVPSTESQTDPRSSKRSTATRARLRGSKLAFKKFSISELADPALVQPPKALISEDAVGSKSKSATSISSLARRGSWILKSDSATPGHQRTPSTNVSKPEKAVTPASPTKSTEAVSSSPSSSSSAAAPFTPSRRPSLAKAGRPLSAIFTRSSSSPQISTLRKAKSSDLLQKIDSTATIPELPTPSRIQRFQSAPVETVRRKDELWNAFRNLDQEHNKFINKPSSFKAVTIRSSLLPFLRQHIDHPSNYQLRATDLDRRINVLNKWWISLLEMVNGRNGYSISPSDRPAVLDALTGIMQRSEWRQTLATLTSSRQSTSKSSHFESAPTDESDFLASNVLNNARSMFVQNLLSQMNFAVDRMSLRTVAASVVAFCGKAIAYAFFFCPGIADILIKLWAQPQITLRRVLDEAGLPRNTKLDETADIVQDIFPSHLQHLCVRSLPGLMKVLRGQPSVRSSLSYINWDGPWIGRWSGRDSDLFFSFTKNYHNLASAFLGEDATDRERICAPGALSIYGQMLTIMDATIQVHKSPSIQSQAVTFDDILGADASAATIPGRAPNTARLMAENRLIMLLREMLSEAHRAGAAEKISFAALFGKLLKAATKKTSSADGDACFILCDFLEESMFILTRFFRNEEDPISFLDWPFWLDVLKRLGESNNTMTEVRLYALIYSLWGYITKDENKKRELCQGWLLKEDYAYRQFNHWCPMVRAYYQRLLVWRLARCEGQRSELDMEIFSSLLSMLQKMFSQYLNKLSTAEQSGTAIPSSTPATPAPGRRLLIIRDDSVPPQMTMLSSVSSSPNDNSSLRTLGSFDALSKLAEATDTQDKTPRKRFTFLRSLNPFTGLASLSDSHDNASPKDSPPSSTHTPGTSTGTSTPESSSSRPSTPPTPTLHHIPSRSFKFSLEWTDRSYPHRMDRKLYPPRLPQPAQAMISRDLADAIVLGDAVPSKDEMAASRYIGIALAEWSILTVEYAAFAERRRYEGVPIGRLETPMLGVETFRKPTG